MRALGVNGIVVEMYWGIVEAQPGTYDWSTYKQLIALLAEEGFMVQVALYFSNNDSVSLPAWVLELGNSNPEIFYTDKSGVRCTECLSLGVDELPVVGGRTALAVYRDLLLSFKEEFGPLMGNTVTDVVIGLGPNGELKYPAHPRDKRWTFPGIGEFQCYDQYMLAALKACSHSVGQPSWGLGGPHDGGSYCMWPHQTGFFHQHGNWSMPYGKFFMQWYSEMLIQHADLVLGMASSVLSGCPVALHAKLPGTHWWYNTASHAAELTAGYYNTSSREGYLPVMSVLARHGVGARLSSAELRSSEAMPQALCDPEKQLAHQRTVAAAVLVPVSLENLDLRFDDSALMRLESALFDTSVYQGLELPQVNSLSFNRMCDTMFEPGNWNRFKNFIRKVRNRADTLVVVPRERHVAAATAVAASPAAGAAAAGGRGAAVAAGGGGGAYGGALQLA